MGRGELAVDRARGNLFATARVRRARTYEAVSDWIGDQTPFVRADWYLAPASRPPLYHELLDMPDTIEALERELDVNVAEDVQHDRSARAGFQRVEVREKQSGRRAATSRSTQGPIGVPSISSTASAARTLLGRPLGP